MSDCKPRTVWIWITGSAIALVIYGLSIGPAFACLAPSTTAERVYRERVCRAIYSPIYWLADHSDFFDQRIARYLSYCAGTRVHSQKEMRQILRDLPR